MKIGELKAALADVSDDSEAFIMDMNEGVPLRITGVVYGPERGQYPKDHPHATQYPRLIPES